MGYFKHIVISLFVVVSISSKLLSVININRHGARSPKTFPNISDKIYFGAGKSQLILNGLRQQQILGKWMYNRYGKDNDLLDKDYDEKDCLFYSSPIARAIFSGAGYLQGLYPKYTIKPVYSSEKINFKTDNIPPIEDLDEPEKEISLIVHNSYHDVIFHPIKCKLNKNSKEKIKDEDFIKTKLFPDITPQGLVEAIDDIKYHLPYLFKGVSPKTFYTTKFLGDLNSFFKQYEEVLKVRHDFKPITKRILRIFNIQKLYGPKIKDSVGKKISASGFFDEFITNFDKIINDDKDKKKFILYSGHDTNLFAIFSNIFDQKYLIETCLKAEHDIKAYELLIMRYASSFIVELHVKHDKYFVRFIFNGQELKKGLHKDLVYDEKIEGIGYNHFKNFLLTRIDMRYKNIYCLSEGDIDYTIPNNYK